MNYGRRRTQTSDNFLSLISRGQFYLVHYASRPRKFESGELMREEVAFEVAFEVALSRPCVKRPARGRPRGCEATFYN